jgi:protein O-GlcNAc transferase
MALETASPAEFFAASSEAAASSAVAGGPQAVVELAHAQARAGRLAQARDSLVACLSAHPGFAPGFLALSRILAQSGHAEDAIACLQQAAALAPADVEPRLELAALWAAAGEHESAAGAYLEVLARVPDHHAVLNNLGLSLLALGRAAEAEHAFRAGLELVPGFGECHANLASLLHQQGRMEEAAAEYRRAVEAKPNWAQAWNNLGIAARALQDHATAERSLREAIRLQPSFVEALYNLGNTLSRSGDDIQAADCYRKALSIEPNHAEALYNLSTVTRDPLAGAQLCEAALNARPDFSEALVGLAMAKLKSCDWDGIDALAERIIALVRDRTDAPVAPFSFLQLCADPVLQQSCARNWVRNRLPPYVRTRPASRAPDPLPPGARLTVGYLSADFRNHAVGNLLVDVFAQHDRQRFEVLGYSVGPDDGSETRRRIAHSMERFTDLRTAPSQDIACRIRADNVHVLVDLTGYTEHGRTEVLALRPAPVQVSYLGFPGTLGADFVDYILADSFVVPAEYAGCYDERVQHLRLCYQVSGSEPSPAPPPRADLGLPAAGFVFCCFNNPYKIRPEVFESWMRILARVPGSVLWLAEFNAASRGNLTRAALARGIAASRLIFAPIVAPREHSRRAGAADLFLDTTPYSAGATASQTLRAGVPVLTIAGTCYVSRMAASLLHALDLQRLIAPDIVAYEQAAVALASEPGAIAQLKYDLHHAVSRSLLFDAVAGARALESAYRAIWERSCDHGSREARAR